MVRTGKDDAHWNGDRGPGVPRRWIVGVVCASFLGAACGGSSTSRPGAVPTSRPTATTARPHGTVGLPCDSAPPLVPSRTVGIASTFIPGHPSELLVCDYEPPSYALGKSAHMAPGPIVAALNATPSRPRSPGVVGCPTTNGEKIALIFEYPDRIPVRVTITGSGCAAEFAIDNTINVPPATLAEVDAALGTHRGP